MKVKVKAEYCIVAGIVISVFIGVLLTSWVDVERVINVSVLATVLWVFVLYVGINKLYKTKTYRGVLPISLVGLVDLYSYAMARGITELPKTVTIVSTVIFILGLVCTGLVYVIESRKDKMDVAAKNSDNS